MIGWYFFLLNVVIPLGLISWLRYGRPRSKTQWWLNVLLITAYMVFIGVTGFWGAYSLYLPIAYACLYGFSLANSLRIYKRIKTAVPVKKDSYMLYVKSFFLLAACCLDTWAFWGYSPGSRSHELSFPLQNGIYYVKNGGTTLPINHCPFQDRQPNGLDIVKLNPLGIRTRVLPRSLRHYEIFSEVVASPCDGTVVRAVDGVSDNTYGGPGKKIKNANSLAEQDKDDAEVLLNEQTGNTVGIQCAGLSIYYLHLLNGSVRVKRDQLVSRGDIIGLVGNSGRSREPHLHIHAERSNSPGEIFSGTSVPLRFKHRYLVRNSLIIK